LFGLRRFVRIWTEKELFSIPPFQRGPIGEEVMQGLDEYRDLGCGNEMLATMYLRRRLGDGGSDDFLSGVVLSAISTEIERRRDWCRFRDLLQERKMIRNQERTISR